MRTKKIGLSILTTFIFLLVFSTTVMAAVPEAPVLTVESGNNQAILSWDVEAGVDNYKVYQNNTEIANLSGSDATYTATGLIIGTKYTFKIEAINGDGTTDSNIVTITAGEAAFNAASDPVTIGATNYNANGTGTGLDVNDGSKLTEVIKAVEGHKTHGSYQNNTNSCASCHQTHTAKARQLLFADSAYNTCAACHDGTLGFYNVFENGTTYLGSETTGGTFGGTHSGNMSVHLATGAVKVSAAPGGNKAGTASNSWGGTFSCASCHAPHGSYSSRLLHYNPANMGNTTPELGGQQAFRVPVVNFADRNKTVAELNADLNMGLDPARDLRFIAVRGTKANHALTTGYESIGDSDVVIMVYSRSVNATTGVVTTTKTSAPWLYGYSTTASGRDYQSRLYTVTPDQVYTEDGSGNPTGVLNKPTATSPGTIRVVGSNFTNQVIDQNDYLNGNGIVYFKYDKGLIFAKSDNVDGTNLLNNAKSADIGRAYKVEFKLDYVKADGDPLREIVKKHDVTALFSNTTNGPALSQWCTTCHTDYLYSSSQGWAGRGDSVRTSVYGNQGGENYYGHTTTSASYTCLRCHYAHGTDVEIMVDAVSNTVHDLEGTMGATEARAYMLDKNPSSALKKFTNQTGCWACHNSSKAGTLKNTNREADHPNGAISDPSTKVNITQP